MGYVDFNRKRNELISKLEELSEGCSSKVVNDLVKRCIDEIRNEKFRISVFGGFSNGKSTLLNALMGFDKEILQVDELASTAAITAIQMPESPELENKARISFNNGYPEKIVPIEEIGQYSAKHRMEDGTCKDDSVEDNIKEVRLFIKSKFLENGVEITDTPGFNSVYQKHDLITKSIVKHSDATIFLFTYEQAGAGTDFEFISLLQENLSRAFLLLNKIDIAYQTNDAESSIESVRDTLTKKLENQGVQLGNKQLFPVSAKYAFEANGMVDNAEKRDKMEKSRFEDFTSALEQYLCSEDFENEKLMNPVKRLKRDIIHLMDENRSIIQTFKDGASGIEQKIASIEAEIAAERKREDELVRSVRRSIKEVFDTSAVRITEEADKITDEIIESINKASTQYAINYKIKHGGGWSDETNQRLLQYWNRLSQKMANDIVSIVSDPMEAEGRSTEALSGQLSQAVNVRLNPVVIGTIDGFEVDYTEIDHEIIKLETNRKKLDANLKEIESLHQKSDERARALREVELLNKDISGLRSSIDEKLMQKAQIQGYRMSRTVYTSRPREGFFGKIANALVGDKRESHTEIYTDNTDADQQRANTQMLIDKDNRELSEAQEEKSKLNDTLRQTDGAEYKLSNKIEEQGALNKQIMKDQERLEKHRDEIENDQVQMVQEKLKSDVRKNVDEFTKDAEKALVDIRKSVNDIVVHLVKNNNEHLSELMDQKTVVLLMQTKNESEQGDEVRRREEELKDASVILETAGKLIG
mgnify:CR=1 FL=1